MKIISAKDGIYQFEDDEIRNIRNIITQHFNPVQRFVNYKILFDRVLTDTIIKYYGSYELSNLGTSKGSHIP